MVADPYRSGSHHRPDGMYGKFGTVGTGDNQRVNYAHHIGLTWPWCPVKCSSWFWQLCTTVGSSFSYETCFGIFLFIGWKIIGGIFFEFSNLPVCLFVSVEYAVGDIKWGHACSFKMVFGVIDLKVFRQSYGQVCTLLGEKTFLQGFGISSPACPT